VRVSNSIIVGIAQYLGDIEFLKLLKYELFNSFSSASDPLSETAQLQYIRRLFEFGFKRLEKILFNDWRFCPGSGITTACSTDLIYVSTFLLTVV
jgi:hypothetical protein